MPRYFFHIRDDSQLIEDEEGLALASEAEAIRQAQWGAKQMLADALLGDDDIGHQVIEVTDDQGTVVRFVHFAVILEDMSPNGHFR